MVSNTITISNKNNFFLQAQQLVLLLVQLMLVVKTKVSG